MREVRGWQCPDYDDNLEDNIREAPQFGGRATYQFYAFRGIFRFIPNFRHGIDIGAHIGTWSHLMSSCFRQVTAFEPMASHAECFRENITASNVTLHEVALGEREMDAMMVIKPPVSLKARILSIETGLPTFPTKVRTLDSFEIEGPLDFVKIDAEGMEIMILKGGEKTIRANKPLLLVEQKIPNTKRYGFRDLAAVDLLKKWGATVLWEKAGDYCLGWKS